MPISDARVAFRKLHDNGCFVIPNPWDAGTARYLRHCGFKALATTRLAQGRRSAWAFRTPMAP